MKKYKYKFSVVVPIYKVEEYLAETIDSVIEQTIGFEENIQVILVNDGSPDNSEKICLEYVEKYPENIKYVYQENAGVSAARNNGINYIEGKYVNFLDSDDKWEADVFEKAWNMFEENDDIDIIGVRQKFFEAANGYPSLDHKFDEDKVVDIMENYDHIQLSVTSGFFRSEAIGDIRYDSRIKYSEDARFINEIIIKKCKLGIIASSVHLYRKRLSENSAIQVKNFRDDWYLVTPELCYKHAFEISKKKFGYVIPYMQYYVAYDYQWRLKEPIPNVISEETCEKYLKITRELFSEIDDQIIFEQKKLNPDLKIEYLKFKYGENVTKDFRYNKKRQSIFYKDLYAYNLTKNTFIILNIFEVNNNKITLKGLININLPLEDYDINLVINHKKRIKLELKETEIGKKKVFNYIYNYSKGFSLEIDNSDIESMYFEISFKGNTIKVNFDDRVFSKVTSKTRIYYKNNKKLYYYQNKEIKIKKASIKNILYCWLRNLKYIITKKEFKVLEYRTLYSILNFFKKKEIWIISDRPTSANDNGYAFFKYLQEINDKEIKTYFVIDQKSRDYDKVKKTGKVLKYNSFKYKLYFLLADKVISSQADPWVNNPFGNKSNRYQDIMNNKFIFLQHGITKDDISVWLNQYEKNMKMFVTSTENEYNSIIKGKYGFDKNVVKLTGLPRYDLLQNKKQKLIAIMPTWRANIAGKFDSKLGTRAYNPSFKTTDYYNFYNKLINEPKLLEVMKKYKYKGIFVVHPSHVQNAIDFEGNDVIKLETELADYSSIFSKASLLISDYSSVPFDFAYLKKPVIYTQFDKEDFFSGHIYTEGYFSYEKDGLGPVINNYEDTVKSIIKYIENDCKTETKYLKRMEKFYKYNDKNNCKRVYEEIKKLK